jgi:hypothetical protein
VRQIGNLDLLMLRFSAGVGVGWTGPRAHWLDPLPCGLGNCFFAHMGCTALATFLTPEQ